jgi:hypothetical protein
MKIIKYFVFLFSFLLFGINVYSVNFWDSLDIPFRYKLGISTSSIKTISSSVEFMHTFSLSFDFLYKYNLDINAYIFPATYISDSVFTKNGSNFIPYLYKKNIWSISIGYYSKISEKTYFLLGAGIGYSKYRYTNSYGNIVYIFKNNDYIPNGIIDNAFNKYFMKYEIKVAIKYYFTERPRQDAGVEILYRHSSIWEKNEDVIFLSIYITLNPIGCLCWLPV